MDAVVTRGLVKRYEEVEALKGIDLTIREGETFGILGPNGAGKTTLINILTTMLPPTEGDAWVAGHSVNDDADNVRRQLGVVFQNQTLDAVMTAEENLRIHGQLYKVPRREIEEQIPRLIELVGLTDRAKDPVSTYSGGMRRRLEIVRAILHKPRVLLLDEPTVALDPQSRATIWEHIRALSKEHKITTIVTTHYMEEADKLCDRIAIVDGGKVTALDSPSTLKAALGGDRLELRLAAGDPVMLGARLEALQDVLGVSAEGDILRLRLREPATTIPNILHEIAEAKARVASMEHRPSSMDDVFLHRTGRSTRDRRKRDKPRGRIWRLLQGGR